MLSDGGGGKEGEDDETDGDRLSSVPLPFGQSAAASAGEQISDKDGELGFSSDGRAGAAGRFAADSFGAVAESRLSGQSPRNVIPTRPDLGYLVAWIQAHR